MAYALLLITLWLQPQQPRMDGAQFMAILEGLHSDIRDFEFVCEGELRWADAAMDLKEKVLGVECAFQGSYAYRSADGAAYLDLYRRPFDANVPFLHGTYAQLKGTTAKTVESSDQKGIPGLVAKSHGAPGAFTFPCSPERFIFLHYWRSLGYSTTTVRFEFEGWEEIDGNAVLRVRIGDSPKTNKPESVASRFWVDMRRGGHVLKREQYRGPVLRNRDYNIRLTRARSRDNKEIWFPAHAEHDSFVWGKQGYRTTPVIHESYDIVRGSLVLNQGLTDKRFALTWKGHLARSAAFEQAAQRYKSISANRSPSPIQTDRGGVEEDQKRRLAEADSQAKQLDASPRGRIGWNLTALIPCIAAVLGFGVLVAAFFLRRRVA